MKTYTLIGYRPFFYEREGWESSELIHIIGLSKEQLIDAIAKIQSDESDNPNPIEVYFFEDIDYDFVNKIIDLSDIKINEIIKQREEEKKRKIELENLEKEKNKKEMELEEMQRLIQKYPTSAKKIIEIMKV